MLLWLSIGFIFLGILIGSAGFKRGGKLLTGAWRPGASMLALAVLVGAVAAALLRRWPLAITLGVIFVWLALQARRRPAPPPPIAKRDMALEEAASMLGVSSDASEDEIQSAYLRLIRVVHPDRGGATGLAVQLNTARDVMLKARRQGR